MNEELDIFSIGDPQTGKWFYHKEIGDSIKGTYIDVREGTDNFNNEQFIYVLKDKEGGIWNVGVRKTNQILNEEMGNKKFGDIVGLKFDEEKESKRYPGKMAKIIRVYPFHTQGPVDEAWLAERAEIEAKLGHSLSTAPVAPTPVAENAPVAEVTAVEVVEPTGTVKPVSTGVTKAPAQEQASEALVAVRNLAKTKGLVTDDMTEAQQDEAISAYAEAPLTDDNFSKVIIKLTSYTK